VQLRIRRRFRPRPHPPEPLGIRRRVGHVEAGRVDRHQTAAGQPRALRARSGDRYRRPVEQHLHRFGTQAGTGLGDRRCRRDLPVVHPRPQPVQAPDQAAHHLVVGLVEEQAHRDHVTDHHVRWQPARALLPTAAAVDHLFERVPIEPGRQHPQPDVVDQPTRRQRRLRHRRRRHDRQPYRSDDQPQHAALTSTDALSERHCVMDPQIAGHDRDWLTSFDHHLHSLGLELRAEPTTLLGHGLILSTRRTCPGTLVHLSQVVHEFLGHVEHGTIGDHVGSSPLADVLWRELPTEDPTPSSSLVRGRRLCPCRPESAGIRC
jgi:hypothetical protein